MTETANQSYIPLTDVPHHMDNHPATNTVRRWAGRGVRGVRLRTWLIGGRRYTTCQAIEQFIAALSGCEADPGL